MFGPFEVWRHDLGRIIAALLTTSISTVFIPPPFAWLPYAALHFIGELRDIKADGGITYDTVFDTILSLYGLPLTLIWTGALVPAAVMGAALIAGTIILWPKRTPRQLPSGKILYQSDLLIKF